MRITTTGIGAAIGTLFTMTGVVYFMSSGGPVKAVKEYKAAYFEYTKQSASKDNKILAAHPDKDAAKVDATLSANDKEIIDYMTYCTPMEGKDRYVLLCHGTKEQIESIKKVKGLKHIKAEEINFSDIKTRATIMGVSDPQIGD